MTLNTLRDRTVLCCVLCLSLSLLFSRFTIEMAHGWRAGGAWYSQTGRQIDLYTQKTPYSGQGPSQPSDAFEPQEEVILYAYVTYNDDPVMGKIVAFEIQGPRNLVENISFTRTAITDEDGMADVRFTMMWPNGYVEEVIFGTWTVIAVVDIVEVEVMDTLNFEVGYTIELLRLDTLDVNHVPTTRYARGELMDFKLTVRNVAMTDRVATLVIDVYDELGLHFGQTTMRDENVPPGVSIYLLDDVVIPESAAFGVGLAVANAYTALPSEGGVPWCPEISTTFSIESMLHDVAVVNVVPFPTEVSPGQLVNITVTVRNEGDNSESFDVSAYYNSFLIRTMFVQELAPEMERTLSFAWSTSAVAPGDYRISAVASTVPGEIDVGDNTFVNGLVRVAGYVPPGVGYPRWLLPLIIILIILVAVNLFLTLVLLICCVTKKKREEESPVTPPQARPASTGRRVCSECGRAFSVVRTFCPYCFAFQGESPELSR